MEILTDEKLQKVSELIKTPDDANIAEQFLCQKSLKYLCKSKLKFKDWDTVHDDLEEWDASKKNDRFRLYLLPRGHLKTSVLSVAKSIQDILIDPDTSILLTSAVWNNSRTFLSEIKEYLSDKTDLPSIFGSFKSDLWNSDQITIAQRKTPNKTPTIDTAGIEKTLTSQHYKIIRADDLVNRENITTREQIQKVINYFKDLLKLLEPDGHMEIIGTRWHDADLYGYIIKELIGGNLNEKFVLHRREAIEDGKVIFPKKFSEKILEDIKKQIGSYDYSCNYLNSPVNPDTQHFKPPFRYWSSIDNGYEHTLTVDLASSDDKSISKKSSDPDFNVIMDCVVNGANQLCVYDYFRSRCGIYELVDKLFSMVQATGVRKVGIESVAYQRIFAKIIEEECRKRNIFFGVIKIIPYVSKFMRIMALQPRYESGNLLLKQGMFELEDEFARFPVGEHDDVLDACEMQLQIISPPQQVQRSSGNMVSVHPAYAKSMGITESRVPGMTMKEYLKLQGRAA